MVDDREGVRQANAQGLDAVMAESRQLIPAREINQWRPTQRVMGFIHGVEGNLVCIATDGIQGIFMRNDGTSLLGHVGEFEWTTPKTVKFTIETEEETKSLTITTKKGAPPALYGLRKEKPTKGEGKKQKRKSKRQQLLELL